PFAVGLGERLALLGGSADRRRTFIRRRRRYDDRGCARARGAARAAGVAGRLLDPDRVADVAREENIALSRGPGDRFAVVARAVALLPLVGESWEERRVGAEDRGRWLTRLCRARDCGRADAPVRWRQAS